MIPQWERDYRNAKGISQSHLKKFLDHPSRFKEYEYSETKTATHFTTGSLVDCLLFFPEEVNDRFYQMPENCVEPSSPNQKDMVQRMVEIMNDPNSIFTEEVIVDIYRSCYSVDKQKPEAVLIKAINMHESLYPYAMSLFMSKDKILVDYKMVEAAEKIVDKIKNNKFYKMLQDTCSFMERPVFYATHLDIAIKGLADMVAYDDKNKIVYIVDLKTTSDIKMFKGQARNYEYALQLAYYRKLLASVQEFKGYSFQAYNIIAETSNTNVISVVKYEPEILVEKIHLINATLNTLSKYIELEKTMPDIWNYYPHELDRGFMDFYQL